MLHQILVYYSSLHGRTVVDLLFARTCAGVRVGLLPGLPLPLGSQVLLLGELLCVTPLWGASGHHACLLLLPRTLFISWDDAAPYLPHYCPPNSSFHAKASCATPILLTFPKHILPQWFALSSHFSFSSFFQIVISMLGSISRYSASIRNQFSPLARINLSPILLQYIVHF